MTAQTFNTQPRILSSHSITKPHPEQTLCLTTTHYEENPHLWYDYRNLADEHPGREQIVALLPLPLIDIDSRIDGTWVDDPDLWLDYPDESRPVEYMAFQNIQQRARYEKSSTAWERDEWQILPRKLPQGAPRKDAA